MPRDGCECIAGVLLEHEVLWKRLHGGEHRPQGPRSSGQIGKLQLGTLVAQTQRLERGQQLRLSADPFERGFHRRCVWQSVLGKVVVCVLKRKAFFFITNTGAVEGVGHSRLTSRLLTVQHHHLPAPNRVLAGRVLAQRVVERFEAFRKGIGIDRAIGLYPMPAFGS